MDFTQKIFNEIKERKLESFTEKQLLKTLKIYSNFERSEASKALAALEEEGTIYYDKKSKKFLVSKNSPVVSGRVSGNSKGFAFIISDDPEVKDTFVAARNLHGALHGDTVQAKILPNDTGDSDEGAVVSILERGIDTVIGTLQASENYGFVTSDDKRYNVDVFIAKRDFKGAKDGEKVVVKITRYPSAGKKNPEGKIVEVLGFADDDGVDVLSIIRSFGLYEEFDQTTLDAAAKVPTEVLDSMISGREDLRGLTTVTIDGEDAKDLDDAISISKKGNVYTLGVHIADVTYYVRQNSPLDKEALKRGTSVYFPDRVLPMLPRELSNGICSLNPGVDRLTLSVFMDIDKKGKIGSYRVSETVIKSSARMTYTSVTKILEGDKEEQEKYKELQNTFRYCKELAEILMSNRSGRGSIDFDLPEAKIIVDEKGDVTEITEYPRKISNKIIEEFMILANETVARYIADAEMPFIYRVHEEPSPEKIQNFREFLQGFGYKIDGGEGNIDPKEFSDLLTKIEGLPVFPIINKVMLRTMMKAKYSPVNVGHFGLASKFYCHFTSPIRRYPDLMIHRIIKLFINGKIDKKKYLELEGLVNSVSVHSSEREKLAEDAEREVDDYFKAKYMSGKIGEVFDGIISGVTEFGVFVQLENTVEGMVRIEALPDDNYLYIKNQYLLKGAKNSFKLSEKLRVQVAAVNLSSKKIDFVLPTD